MSGGLTISDNVVINVNSVKNGYISYCIQKMNLDTYRLENEYPELTCMPYFRLRPESAEFPYLEGHSNWEHETRGDFGRLPVDLLAVLVSLLDCRSFQELTQTCKFWYFWGTKDEVWKSLLTKEGIIPTQQWTPEKDYWLFLFPIYPVANYKHLWIKCPDISKIKMKMYYATLLDQFRKKVGITVSVQATSKEELHEVLLSKFGVDMAKAD